MNNSVSAALPRFTEWLDQDDAPTLARWLRDPRGELAWALHGAGNAVLRVAHRIDDATPGDVGDAMSEEFHAGFRMGERKGSRRALDIAKLTYEAGRSEGAQA